MQSRIERKTVRLLGEHLPGKEVPNRRFFRQTDNFSAWECRVKGNVSEACEKDIGTVAVEMYSGFRRIFAKEGD